MLRPQVLEALLIAGSVFVGMTAPVWHRHAARNVVDTGSVIHFQLISGAGLETGAARATIWLADRVAHLNFGLAGKGCPSSR